MTPLQILRGARELLAKPERWTKDTLARDARGIPCGPYNSEADCFCLVGAMSRAQGLGVAPNDKNWRTAVRALGEGSRDLASLTRLNDAPTTTHADILALLDQGIAQLDAATVKDSLTVRTKEPSE